MASSTRRVRDPHDGEDWDRMQTLSVLTVEDGVIIVASPAGERFRLPVDAALRSRLVGTGSSPDEKRLSPREIQAHIRAGLTADQVAAMTGVPVALIERFVGPVLAERAYIVESALAVRLPPETEGARSRTFGAVMGERLDALAARDVRWTSAKEPSGWVLAVGFVADDVQHDARWRFDPKHMRLDPDNVEASTLSQQGVPAALTPRLRAIEPTAPVTVVPQPQPQPQSAPRVERPTPLLGSRVAPTEPDRTRFDSAAFRFPPLTEQPPAAGSPAARATDPAEQRTAAAHATDRLEQLGRRRGQRQPPPDADSLPPTSPVEVVRPDSVFAARPGQDRRDSASVHRLPLRPPVLDDLPAEERPTEPLRRRRDRGGLSAVQPVPQERGAQDPPVATTDTAATEAATPTARPRRGRTSMPSWDEIVFGRDEPSP